MNLVESVYRATAAFPKEETYGLRAQLRSAVISVPSNIAEGAARNSSREMLQFLGIATGSLAELETQIEVAIRLRYIPADIEALTKIRQVGKLLTALRNAFRTRTSKRN
jgi:four helix bundle protein